jgi:hypothetical protein
MSLAAPTILVIDDMAAILKMVKKRLEIVRRMAEANIEDMPDPEELSRQLAEAHDPGLP